MKLDLFEKELNILEEQTSSKSYILKLGSIPVILTAPHTMLQKRKDGRFKVKEPYTKAIAMYVAEQTKGSYLVKIRDTGLDSNRFKVDTFKKVLLRTIKENNIKLLLDIHGAARERDFDVELGTLNNLSSNSSTINKLKEAFKNNKINKIEVNNPFKGGGITQYIYGKTNIDIIQIEINGKYRDIKDVQNIKKICDSLIEFISENYK